MCQASKQYFENVLAKRREREDTRQQLQQKIHNDVITNGYLKSNEKVDRLRLKNKLSAIKESEEQENALLQVQTQNAHVTRTCNLERKGSSTKAGSATTRRNDYPPNGKAKAGKDARRENDSGTALLDAFYTK